MRLIKTINRQNEVVKLYNQPLNGGESITMNGRQYWMIKEYKNLTDNKTLGFGKSSIRQKQCGNCSKTNSVSQFYTDSYSKDGFTHWCKSCVKEYSKQYRQQLQMVGQSMDYWMISRWNEMTLNFYLSKEISKDKMEVMLDRYEDDLNTFYSKIYNDFSQNRKRTILEYN